MYRPFRSPADLDPEEAITAWELVAAGFSNLAGFDVENPGNSSKAVCMNLVNGTRLGLDVSDFRGLAKVVKEPQENFTRALYPECFIDVEERST